MRSQPFRLAIVGAGPGATYTIERLAATAADVDEPFTLEVHVFEKTGEFGAGQVHSATQPRTSFLNRIAGQVAFGADESVVGAGRLLPAALRPTLHEWCRQRFRETGNATFDIGPEDWPERYIHGLALQDCFRTYVELLRRHPGVTVHHHDSEVVDVEEMGGGLELVTTAPSDDRVVADHVLFVTGHSSLDPGRSPTTRRWSDFARTGAAVYVPSAYPLEHTIPEDSVKPGRVVGCLGMGLTAMDVILYLTEGRGGRFVPAEGGRLRYEPSGREPAGIVAFGRSGLFTFARPCNAKERDAERLEHRAVFFTRLAIDRLRASRGDAITVSPQIGERRQLDFEADVLPLVVLEMAYVYYRTLLGADFGRLIQENAAPVLDAFLDGGRRQSLDATLGLLLAPVEAAVDDAVSAIDGILFGDCVYSDQARLPWSVAGALERYTSVVFGPAAWPRVEAVLESPGAAAKVSAGLTSPWGHALRLGENRFSWRETIEPIPPAKRTTPSAFLEALRAFMARDHLWAAQDNLTNPAKAAADGVWRDLRPVLGYAVDLGGLKADSHRTFLATYMRYHNHLANGASVEVMAKVAALIDRGLLDPSVGPDPSVEVDQATGRFVVCGSETGYRRSIDTLVDARVHTFDPEADASSLYRNLYRRGLVRRWRNPASDGRHFEPGGLDLTPEFNPVRADGSIDRRLAFLGPPSEGALFFQLGALRPNQNHHVMQDILSWLHRFWDDVAAHCARQAALGDYGDQAPARSARPA